MDTPENICKFVMNDGTEEDIKMMNKMLQDGLISGQDVRCREWYNGTALMYQSSFNGTFKAMEFLIDKGVNVHLTNDLRETALFYAVGCTIETGLRQKSFLLLSQGATVLGLKNTSGLTLIEACDNQDMKAELERLKAENEALKSKSASRGTLSMKVSEKGALSIYGMGRFPVTLYKEQWLKLLGITEEIRKFISDNDSKLKTKE